MIYDSHSPSLGLPCLRSAKAPTSSAQQPHKHTTDACTHPRAHTPIPSPNQPPTHPSTSRPTGTQTDTHNAHTYTRTHTHTRTHVKQHVPQPEITVHPAGSQRVSGAAHHSSPDTATTASMLQCAAVPSQSQGSLACPTWHSGFAMCPGGGQLGTPFHVCTGTEHHKSLPWRLASLDDFIWYWP